MRNVYIEAVEASYRYGKNGFSLVPGSAALALDEIVFLRGANGSGKSTWMKLLAGIYKPQEGLVRIDGEDSARMTLGQIGTRLGYLFQNPSVQLFAETVREEMMFADALKGIPVNDSEETAMYWLRELELEHRVDASVYRLSGGERQRLALAVILAQGAQYLMLDEPSKNLDETSKAGLIHLLKRLRAEKHLGMLIISHDDGLEKELADAVLYAEEGRLLGTEKLF